MLAVILKRPRTLAFVAGLLLPLAFAPFAIWPLAIFVVAGIVSLWQTLSGRHAFWCGFWFGAGAFLAGTYWIYISVAVFGRAPGWLAVMLMLGLVLIMAVYYGLTALTISRYAPARRSGIAVWVVAPASWVLFEWARGWLLSGFPWVSLGYSQLDSPLAGFAPVLGVYGVSLCVVLVALGLVAATRRRWAGFAVSLTLLGAGFALNQLSWTDRAGADLSVALVQGAVSQDKKWLAETRAPTLTFYEEQTLANRDVDVIVWPEVAIPAIESAVAGYLDRLSDELKRNNTALVLGVLQYQPEPRQIQNAMVTRGNASGVFRKHHLVPFGEYFPVPAFVREWMRLQSLPNSDMTPGDRRQAGLTVAGYPVASSICYEDAYASEQRYFFPAARFMINITNDAWFGDSIAPHHHLDIARMRSLESGRWQLRAANTGVTAIIAPNGMLTGRLPQFEPGVLRGQIVPRKGLTPYLALGNGPLISLCFALLVFFEIRRRRGVQ